MKRFISLSGGVESTTMCVLYGKGATAIWANTGWEHKETLQRIKFLETELKKLHKGDFNLVTIIPDVSAKGIKVNSLEDYIKRSEFMPSKQMRYCTSKFKINPIDKFLKSQHKCELLIGLNAEESTSRVGNYMKNKNVVYKYPLVDDDLSRDDCVDILNIHGLHPDFPPYMQRGGCKGCIFKSQSEWRALYHLDNKTFKEIQDLEESIQSEKKQFFTVSMSKKSMAEIALKCEQEKQMFSRETLISMYEKIKPSKSCGVFCHR